MKYLFFIFLFAINLEICKAKDPIAAQSEVIVGIGITLQKLNDGSIRVDKVYPNTPAELAGLSSGDIIHGVRPTPGDQIFDVRNFSLPAIVAMIRGPLGLPVALTFSRGDMNTKHISIKRVKFLLSNHV